MKDRTQEFDAQDAQTNKTMGILAYISFLVLVPIFSAKESKWARFHANQGLVLFIAEVALWLTAVIFGFIPVLKYIIPIVCYLGQCGCVALSVIGIVNAAKGKAVELPLIGSIKILK